MKRVLGAPRPVAWPVAESLAVLTSSLASSSARAFLLVLPEGYEMIKENYKERRPDEPESTLEETDKGRLAKIEDSGPTPAWNEHDPASWVSWGWVIKGPSKWIEYAAEAKGHGLCKSSSISEDRSPAAPIG